MLQNYKKLSDNTTFGQIFYESALISKGIFLYITTALANTFIAAFALMPIRAQSASLCYTSLCYMISLVIIMAVGREHINIDFRLENAIHQTMFLGDLTTPAILRLSFHGSLGRFFDPLKMADGWWKR